MKFRITIHVDMVTGHEFTDCIELAEQECTPQAMREYIHIKAKSRGFRGISDVLAMEATITL
jgi:hypothetical protein